MIIEVPGGEIPRYVYATVIGGFVWMMLAAWMSFGVAIGTDLDLSIATLIVSMMVTLPFLIRATALRHLSSKRTQPEDFLHSEMDTSSGWLSGTEAWVQIALGPVALAIAATAIGTAHAIIG
ncbi:MAG: hypothetical protein APF80_07680 [Alphaproteobacteria bacterium BRH_c36]|nr:MAG: hypothetical protein APF80_07680 [Alphaproteobacteria bacterium BRH_c36]